MSEASLPRTARDRDPDVVAASDAGATAPITAAFPFRVGALAILGLSLVWRLWTMAQWSWFLDDWAILGRSRDIHTLAGLFQNYDGHVIPGQFLLAKILVSISPLNFAWAAASSLLLVAATVVMWILALREIFGERLRVLYAVLILACTPLLLPISLWWAAALQVYPLLCALTVVILGSARYAYRGRRLRDLALVWAGLGFGLAFSEKAILVILPALLVAFLCSTGTTRQRWVRMRPLALSLIGLAALYAGAYISIMRTVSDSSRVRVLQGRSLGQALEFFFHGIVDIGIPALVGGPAARLNNSQEGFFPADSLALATVILVLVVHGGVTVVRYRRWGWLLVAGAFGYAVCSWGLLLTSSRYDAFQAISVRDGRYAADILVVALLALTWAFTPTRAENATTWATWPRIPGDPALHRRVLVIGFAVVALATAVLNGTGWTGIKVQSPKTWLDNVLADAGRATSVSVADTKVPDTVIPSSFFWVDSRLSGVLSYRSHDFVFDAPAHDLYTPGDDGRLRQMTIRAFGREQRPLPKADCGYLVEPGRSTQVPIRPALPAGHWGVQVEYFSGEPQTARIPNSGKDLAIPIERGLAHVQYVTTDAVDAITVVGDPHADPFCVATILVGIPQGTGPWLGEVPGATR